MGMDTQNDTRVGDLPLVAGEDLTGMEGLLAVLSNDGGQSAVVLPGAATDVAAFVVVEGAAAGESATVRPLESVRNVRLRLSGDCVPGDVLVAADPTDPLLRGLVTALPAVAGTYRGLAIAEQAGETGQLVLARPVMVGNIEVV